MKTKSLPLSKYAPKFTDPRVLRRTTAVLDWCKPLLLSKKPRPFHSSALTNVFGNQKDQLAAYLRSNLLIQSGTYKPGQSSYSYSLRREGFLKLATAIGQPVSADAETAKQLYREIAQGTEQPKYTEPVKGARRYHPVQNLPKKLRAEVFKGWYDYDIEAAAPTLVYQFACQALAKLGYADDKTPFPNVARLVRDRSAVRQHLADLTGLDQVTVKQILIALFFGSKLVPNPKRAIFRILDQDYEMTRRLKADPFVKAFCRDVQLMWSLVLTADNIKKGRAVLFDGAKPKAKPTTKAKHRMAIYIQLERQVMDVVDAELREQGVTPVLIHDGFMTKTCVDRLGLERVVAEKTGYKIRLAEAQVGTQDENLKAGLSDDLTELPESMI